MIINERRTVKQCNTEMASQLSSRRCCLCNGSVSAKCLRCACVSPCTNCLPGDLNSCRNQTNRLPNTQPNDASVTAMALVVITPPDPALPTSQLPSLITIFQTPLPTLKHVPKGARDMWARVLHGCLSSICDSPNYLSQLSAMLMLT